MAKIGIIGGSGIYKIEGLKNLKEINVQTPFGRPSDVYRAGELGGFELVFLPRHGSQHTINPSEINYKANIYGMKKLGVERLISVSACGSLRRELKPLDFVLPDQFVDRTNQARAMTFFEKGIVAHISFASPVCGELSGIIHKAAKDLKLKVHAKGTYINMEGPAFSTKAESNLYRAWGMDIIGMTNMAEARLAREAEMCYVTVAAITDYDCWHEAHESVTVEMIIANLTKNAQNSKELIKALLKRMPQVSSCSCHEALKYAFVTQKDAISPEVKQRLEPIIGKYMR